MVKIVFNKRLRDYRDADHLIQVQKLTLVGPHQREMIRRAERAGRTLYATTDPYAAEMGSGEPVQPRELLLAQSQAELDECFYQRRGEI